MSGRTRRKGRGLPAAPDAAAVGRVAPLRGPGRPRFAPVRGCVGGRHRPAPSGPDTEEVVMAKTKRGLSAAERAERRARDRERLRQAARELLTSDGWQRWVRARALFHNYSLRNCLLLAAQCHERGIHARRVAGFRTWLKLGRCVRKGEKALVVLAPMPIKRRESNEEPDEARVVFRSAFVFADSQTDLLPGVDPAPIEPPCEPLTGDSHRHLLEHLRSFAREIDFEVALEPISGSVGGWCDPKRRRVVVDAGLPANAQVRVLVPWRKGRIPTFGMLSLERRLSGRGSGGSE